MYLTRRNAIATSLATLLTATVSTTAHAGTPETFAAGGIAINGYDPVGYFKMSKPVEGSPDHTSQYNGATWQFSSAQNKVDFDANPASFAPKYGGYCAYAASKGSIAKTEPDAWTIVNGQLYLNYDVNVRTIWANDVPGNIELADANWPDILN